MDNATKAHNDFSDQLSKLIVEFHKEHPDLFINGIDIVSGVSATEAKIFFGVKVEILVQPS